MAKLNNTVSRISGHAETARPAPAYMTKTGRIGAEDDPVSVTMSYVQVGAMNRTARAGKRCDLHICIELGAGNFRAIAQVTRTARKFPPGTKIGR